MSFKAKGLRNLVAAVGAAATITGCASGFYAVQPVVQSGYYVPNGVYGTTYVTPINHCYGCYNTPIFSAPIGVNSFGVNSGVPGFNSHHGFHPGFRKQ